MTFVDPRSRLRVESSLVEMTPSDLNPRAVEEYLVLESILTTVPFTKLPSSNSTMVG